MWTIAAVNKKFDGPLGSYNGLTDVHLAHYFSRPFRRSHLKAANLITGDGTIIPEQKVKVDSLRYEKKRKIYDILANAVVQNAIHKEGTWNKKLCSYLEDISKMEAVEKIKVAAKKKQGRVSSISSNKIPEMNQLFTQCDILGSLHNQDIRKQISGLPSSAPSTCFRLSNDNHYQNMPKRSLSAKEHSPYIIPLLAYGSSKHLSQSMLQQILLSRKRKKKRKRKINKIISERSKDSENDPISVNNTTKLSVPEQRFNINQCKITLYYHGHFLLTNCHKNMTQDIIIKQQHCGGTPVVVYKGNVAPNESLTFICLEHKGFPFSITVFLDGIRDLKLCSCCVFRYIPGRRLGGPSGTFSIHSIEGGKPCLKCQYKEIEAKGGLEANLKSLENLTGDDDGEINAMPYADIKVEQPRDISTENDSLILQNYEENGKMSPQPKSIEDSVIAVETPNTPDEEIEEILDDSELHESGIGNKNATEEEIIEETNLNSVDDVKATDESSYDSESSVASVNETPDKLIEIKKFQEISIGSESSEDDGGKQHVIIASVHGSPS